MEGHRYIDFDPAVDAVCDFDFTKEFIYGGFKYLPGSDIHLYTAINVIVVGVTLLLVQVIMHFKSEKRDRKKLLMDMIKSVIVYVVVLYALYILTS